MAVPNGLDRPLWEKFFYSVLNVSTEGNYAPPPVGVYDPALGAWRRLSPISNRQMDNLEEMDRDGVGFPTFRSEDGRVWPRPKDSGMVFGRDGGFNTFLPPRSEPTVPAEEERQALIDEVGVKIALLGLGPRDPAYGIAIGLARKGAKASDIATLIGMSGDVIRRLRQAEQQAAAQISAVDIVYPGSGYSSEAVMVRIRSDSAIWNVGAPAPEPVKDTATIDDTAGIAPPAGPATKRVLDID